MRILLLCFSALLCLASNAARADDIFGTPVILVSGVMMLDGRDVTLWGIDTLAPDQQCWHEDVAWNCGEEAMTTLRHVTEGRLAHCIVKQDLGNNSVLAQCFLQGGNKEIDVARFLVAHGWALDQNDVTEDLYADVEAEALAHGRGIWTSKFQSAEDWRNGVQRFVIYQKPETSVPATAGPDVYYNTVPAGPLLLERQRLLDRNLENDKKFKEEQERKKNQSNDDKSPGMSGTTSH